MFFTSRLLPLQCLYTNRIQTGFSWVDYFVLCYLKKPSGCGFHSCFKTVPSRDCNLCLSAFLPLQTPAPVGRCGQSGQRANPAKTHFSPPMGLLFTRIPWLRQRSRSLLAGSCCAQGRPCLLGDGAGSRQLSRQSMCTLGCLLEAVYTMLWTLPHSPLQSQKA